MRKAIVRGSLIVPGRQSPRLEQGTPIGVERGAWRTPRMCCDLSYGHGRRRNIGCDLQVVGLNRRWHEGLAYVKRDEKRLTYMINGYQIAESVCNIWAAFCWRAYCSKARTGHFRKSKGEHPRPPHSKWPVPSLASGWLGGLGC